jgi:hypothetical protein
MSFLLKDPDAVLDYLIDWAAEYLGTDVLTNSEWSVEPSEPGGVTVVPGEFDGRTAVVKASGGIAGHIYRLVNTLGRWNCENSHLSSRSSLSGVKNSFYMNGHDQCLANWRFRGVGADHSAYRCLDRCGALFAGRFQLADLA